MKKIFLLSTFTILTLASHITVAKNNQPMNNVSNISHSAINQESSSTSVVFEHFSQLKKSQPVSPEYNQVLQKEVTSYLNDAPATFDKSLSQYFVLVDSAFKQQNLIVAFWDSNTKTFQLSPTMTKVSTGRTGSAQHFITPIGWVEQLPENGTYRAEGTKNQNGIRGYGAKGMRVWDFGWQNAYTGWLKKPEIRQIRMQMHATDPQFLEQRLGNPASQGCLRLAAETNQFIDKHGLIDRKIENSTQAWTLRKDRTSVANAGSFVLVINTDPTSIAHNLKAALPVQPVMTNPSTQVNTLTPASVPTSQPVSISTTTVTTTEVKTGVVK